MAKFVYEKDFFSLEESLAGSVNVPTNANTLNGAIIPKTPWMSVQFRTSASENIENDGWTEVANRVRSSTRNANGIELEQSKDGYYTNTYVKNFSIEDSGGGQRLKLTLFDPDFSRLENIIISSYLSVQSLNQLSKKLNKEIDVAYLQFSRQKTTSVNFRVRFGYTEQSASDDIIDTTSMKDTEWLERIKDANRSKLVIRSPWIYFQILNLNFNTSRQGIKVNIDSIATSRGWLDFVKIIQRNVRIEGTPIDLLQQMGSQIFEASLGNVAVLDPSGKIYATDNSQNLATNLENSVLKGNTRKSDSPVNVTVNDPEEEGKTDLKVQLSLGSDPRQKKNKYGEPTGEVIRSYMGIKDIFNQISQKTPKKYRAKDEDESKDELTQKVMDEQITDKSKLVSIPYKWSSFEIDGITFITFNYIDEKKILKAQPYYRVYRYGYVHDSLIQNFDINSTLDFAQLNVPLAIKENGENVKFYVGAGSEEADVQVSATENVTNKFQELLNNGQLALISDVEENFASDTSAPASSQTLADAYIAELNDQIFSGTIEILGDPFYMFDREMKPYQYGIKINFLRPGQLTGDRGYELESSYLSGIYLVSKITHNLGRNGYRTSLELKRFPGNI